MHYWLMKSEPDCFSIDDLQNAPKGIASWDGVRNYQARNFIRDIMAQDDLAFFYHSNAKPPGIAGIMQIVHEAYPDHTAFDPDSEHPDLHSSPENPRWYMVDVQFKQKFNRLIPLSDLKASPLLSNMLLLRPGNRLSIMPVEKAHWDYIIKHLV